MKKWRAEQIKNEIHKIMRADLKNFSPNKLKNLKEMETFINAYDLPNLHQEEINILNRTKASSEGEANI